MTDKEFETYWKENRMTILDKNDEYRHAKENFKIHSGADLILFGIPVVAGIVSINNVPLQNELLKWVVSAVITIVCFALSVWVKSLITGTVSPDEVEQRLKEAKRRNSAYFPPPSALLTSSLEIDRATFLTPDDNSPMRQLTFMPTRHGLYAESLCVMKFAPVTVDL